MQKLMAIFAHPDDEGAVAGTLAHYADWGVEVQLVCATRGEVGTISDPALATRATDAANAYASGRMGASAGQTAAMQSAFGIPGGMLNEGLQMYGGLQGMGFLGGGGSSFMPGNVGYTGGGARYNFLGMR